MFKTRIMEKIFIKNEWVEGISDGLTLECQCCGHLPYIDYNVTDDFWKEVVPDKMRLGVICFRCLDKMATEKGKDVADHLIRFQFTGEGKTIEMTPKRAFYYSQRDSAMLSCRPTNFQTKH